MSRTFTSRRGFLGSMVALPLAAPAGAGPEILIDRGASPSEQWAADELRTCLAQWPTVKITVGRSALTDRYGLAIPEGEACLLRTCGDILVIAGGRGRGTMYGVFAFLESLGFRWYTADVRRAPPPRRIILRGIDMTVRPAFSYREVFFTEAQSPDWSAHNRLNGNFHRLDANRGGKISYRPFAHSFYDLVPPGEFFDPHPEYFALIAGKRRRENAQLCLTNTAIVPIAQARMRRWMAERPEADVVSVSQNDGGGWCECDECSRVVREEGGAVSGLLLRFVNRVAAPFEHSNPQLAIDTLAYQRTIDPPARARPASNVQIRFCPIDACQAHSYGSCIFNRRVEERLAGWVRIAPRLIVWHYSINFGHFLLPFPNLQELETDIRRFRESGVSGVFVEGAVSEGGGADDPELRSYLTARLLWDPKTDVGAEMRGFLRAVYGDAAGAMAAYHAIRRGQVRRDHLWVDQDPGAPYLTQGFLNASRRTLTEARAAAKSSGAQRRIDRALLGLDYAAVMRGRSEIGPFISRAQALGVTNLREGQPIDSEARQLAWLNSRHEEITLSAGPTTATLVPALGARMTQLRDRERRLLYGWTAELASSYVNLPTPLEWKARESSANSVLLAAPDLELEVRLEDRTLNAAMTLLNSGRSTIPATLRFQNEIPLDISRGVGIEYVAIAGGRRRHDIVAGPAPADGSMVFSDGELPRDRLSVREQCEIEMPGAGRCAVGWSFRNTPRLRVMVASPEVMLAPAEQLTLRSRVAFAR